jgi:hypothetical protein
MHAFVDLELAKITITKRNRKATPRHLVGDQKTSPNQLPSAP